MSRPEDQRSAVPHEEDRDGDRGGDLRPRQGGQLNEAEEHDQTTLDRGQRGGYHEGRRIAGYTRSHRLRLRL